jgi:hypothetical protein
MAQQVRSTFLDSRAAWAYFKSSPAPSARQPAAFKIQEYGIPRVFSRQLRPGLVDVFLKGCAAEIL